MVYDARMGSPVASTVLMAEQRLEQPSQQAKGKRSGKSKRKKGAKKGKQPSLKRELEEYNGNLCTASARFLAKCHNL